MGHTASRCFLVLQEYIGTSIDCGAAIILYNWYDEAAGEGPNLESCTNIFQQYIIRCMHGVGENLWEYCLRKQTHQGCRKPFLRAYDMMRRKISFCCCQNAQMVFVLAGEDHARRPWSLLRLGIRLFEQAFTHPTAMDDALCYITHLSVHRLRFLTIYHDI